jgi:ABC-2 type transport system ATP-binding protein
VARARAEELLERFDLADAADRLVRTFSGGMRRRLDLAASLVATPPVLFLDEPTTGLDPRSRIELWNLLRELVRDGATMLLTTQYLEEADRLADDIVVLDGGHVVAHGAPAQLKARIGGERLEVTVGSASELVAAAAALSAFASDQPAVDNEASRVVAPVKAGVPLAEVVRALDAAGVSTTDLHRREATLDDVFLALTEPTATPTEIAA